MWGFISVGVNETCSSSHSSKFVDTFGPFDFVFNIYK